jgi:hypothetical protein
MTSTITPTPTITPENFGLAESGFDIADVRVVTVQADTVHINFKYQIDRNYVLQPDQKLFVMLLIPTNCKDEHTNDPRYYFEDSIGTGWLAYRQYSSSRCSLPFFDMTINVIDKDDDTNVHFQEVYRERIKQPLEVAGNLSIIDARNLTIKNVEFHTTGSWSGQLTFEYAFRSDVPLASQQYLFLLVGDAVVRPCSFSAEGPLLNRLEGRYIIDIQLSTTADLTCLNKHNSFSYTGGMIVLQDVLTHERIYYHSVGFTLTFKKAP